ncbi:MAG: T9SS type A sorting domain-containing protein [Saprospiraceae bacterium]
MNYTLVFSFFLLIPFANAQTLGWNKSYGGNGNEYSESIVTTSDGGFLVSGNTSSTNGNITQNHGGQDAWVIKLSSQGALEWQKTYGGTGTDGFNYAIAANDGGYIMVGFTESNNGDVTENKGLKDLWLVKTNATGTISWQKTLGGSSADVALSICSTSNGYYVSGVSSSLNGDVLGATAQGDAWMLKINNTGAIQWQKAKGGTAYDEFASVKPTADGGCVALGTMYIDQFSTKLYVVKFESTGTIQFEKSYGGAALDAGTDVVVTTTGEYVYSGTVKSTTGDVSNNHGKKDIWVVKANSVGAIVWQKTIGGSQDDEGSALSTNNKDEIFVGGFSASADGDVSINKGSSDVLLAKLNSSGSVQWVKAYGSVLTNLGNSITLGNNNNLVVAATSTGSGGDVPVPAVDAARLIWVFSLDGVSATKTLQDESFSFKIGPNPALDELKINLEKQFSGRLEVRNAGGQLMFVKMITQQEIVVNLQSLASGNYFATVINKDGHFTRSFIKF